MQELPDSIPPSTSTSPPAPAAGTIINPSISGASGGSTSRPVQVRRRRSEDKLFTCDVEGCDKTYHRVEHLKRHQLNRKSLLRSILFDSVHILTILCRSGS